MKMFKRAICCWTTTTAVVLGMYASTLAETITDDFNDGILGTNWQVVTQDVGTSWDELGGVLNAGGFSGQTGELVLRYNRAIADVGLVCIDYNWVSCTGHKARVGLGLYGFDSYSYGVYVKNVRYGTNANSYAIDGGIAGVSPRIYYIEYDMPASGSLMIERNGNDFRASYLDNGNWQVLFETQYDFSGMPLYPYLFTSNSDTNPSWQVELDNFSADVVVPEPSILVLLGISAVSLLAYTWRQRRVI